MIFITSMNNEIFRSYGKRFIETFTKNSRHQLVIFSEDILYSPHRNILIKKITDDRLLTFQSNFRNKYKEKLKFFKYHDRMDIWAIKIFVIYQALNELGKNNDLVWIDADSKVLNTKFDEIVSDIVKKTDNIGIFLRKDTHLHPESGFLVIKRNAVKKIIRMYQKIIESIQNESYTKLPSWTDCSLLENAIKKNRFSSTDYCLLYNLKTSNPIRECSLKNVYRHNKGGAKKSIAKIIYADLHYLYERYIK